MSPATKAPFTVVQLRRGRMRLMEQARRHLRTDAPVSRLFVQLARLLNRSLVAAARAAREVRS